MFKFGDIAFKSIQHTISLVITSLPSATYSTFDNVVKFWDTLDSIYLSNRDFVDEKYHTSHNKFDNEVTTSVSISFGRELLHIFGYAKSSITSIQFFLLVLFLLSKPILVLILLPQDLDSNNRKKMRC